MDKQHWHLLGMSFYWAWMSVVFFSPVLSSLSGIESIDNMSFWFAFSVSACLVCCFAMVFCERVKTLMGRPVVLALAALFGTMGTLLIPFGLLLASMHNLYAMVFCVGGAIIAGVSSALISLMWGEVYGALPDRTCLMYTLRSYLLLALFHFIIVSLPHELGVLVIIVLPSASCLFLLAEKSQSLQADQPACVENGLRRSPCYMALLQPLAAIFLFGCSGELLHGLSLFPETPNSTMVMGNLYTLGGAVGVGLFALALHWFKSARAVDRCIAMLPTLMALGLVVPTLLSSPYAVVYAVFGATFWCFRVAIWCLCGRMVKQGMHPLFAYGMQCVGFYVAIMAGIPLSGFVFQMIGGGLTDWKTVVLVVVAVVFLVAIIVFPERKVAALWGLATVAPGTRDEQDAPKRALKKYRLSNREIEVALLLAEGRTLPYIQDALCISQGTANTHLRHIYEKMGVHNRQEFIDRIKEA